MIPNRKLEKLQFLFYQVALESKWLSEDQSLKRPKKILEVVWRPIFLSKFHVVSTEIEIFCCFC